VLLCGEKSQRVRAIDLPTGAISATEINEQSGGVCALLDSSDGTVLIEKTCGKGDYVVWRLDGGGAAARLVVPAAESPVVFAYTADGKTLVIEQAAEGDEIVTQLVDAEDGNIEAVPGVFVPIPTDHPSRVIAHFDDDTTGAYDLDTRQRVGQS